MKNVEKIYKRICEIADAQFADKTPISRADLDYLLRKDGFGFSDGQDVSRFVYEAYMAYGRSANIREYILDNAMQKSVVELYELQAELDAGNSAHALQIANSGLAESKKAITAATTESSGVFNLQLATVANSLIQSLRGDQGLREVQMEANALMENYGRMVDGYRLAEQSVKDSVHQFVVLRSKVHLLYTQYAQALIDIFGDNIKAVAPKLFDFDSIPFLDVSSMLQQRTLEFNRLDESCTLLTGEVAANFKKVLGNTQDRLKQSASGMKLLGKSSGSSSLALLGANLLAAAFDFIDHQLDAQDKTVRMQRELGKMKDGVRRDKYQIEADLSRLTVVLQTLSNVYIPRAEAFYRLSGNVVSADLKNFLDSVYDGSKVSALKAKRDELMARIAQLEVQMADHQENIAYYSARIADEEGMLASQAENYKVAKEAKPSRPGLVSNAITLGSAKRKYQEAVALWRSEYGGLVEAYEDACVSVKLYKEDLAAHQQGLDAAKNEYGSLRKELGSLNKQMLASLSCTSAQKKDALKYLNGVLGVLHTAKVVCESKLDDSLTRVAPVADVSFELPQEISDNLKCFVSTIAGTAQQVGSAVAGEYAQAVRTGVSAESAAEMAKQINESAAHLNAVGNHAAAKAASLIENWLYLQGETMRSQLSNEVYAAEVEKLKDQFRCQMRQVENQSEALGKILAKANTATDREVLRQALADLAGDSFRYLSESDFDALLRGEKTIEI